MFDRARRLPRPAPHVARGERIYAIGDVHGRFDLLVTLLGLIQAKERRLPRAHTRLVFLGDIIDRGPRSREVVQALMQLTARDPRAVVLRGNHEAALLDSLAGDSAAQRGWLSFGGLATLASYGVAPPAADEDAIDFAERLRAGVPEAVQAFLRGLPLTLRSGDYLFCHAGVRPGVAIEKQRDDDLLWIRDEFLRDERHHGAVVVHGHSIVDRVDVRANRIAVDTGAYRSGVLSAVCLYEDRQWPLATG